MATESLPTSRCGGAAADGVVDGDVDPPLPTVIVGELDVLLLEPPQAARARVAIATSVAGAAIAKPDSSRTLHLCSRVLMASLQSQSGR
jgi:hypothetical protein